jgi:hypothetical protein
MSSSTLADTPAYREETSAATSGYPHSMFSGYDSIQGAEAAWTQALRAGRTGPPKQNMEMAQPGNSMYNLNPIYGVFSSLLSATSANSSFLGQNLSDQSHWVVIRGRYPGVYVGKYVVVTLKHLHFNLFS